MKHRFIIIYLLFLVFNSCTKKNACLNSVKGKYINQSQLDGCSWAIELKNKQKLKPINLNDFESDPKEGRKIWISYSVKEDMFDICMSGQIIEILCISKR